MLKPYDTVNKELREKLAMLTGGNYVFGPFIPCQIKGQPCERIFLYSGAGRSKNRPYLSVLINSQNGAVLEFRNAYVGDFADGEKYPLGGAMDYSVPTAKTAVEQGELLKKLNGLYAEVREFAFTNELDERQGSVLREYADCLKNTVPASLLAFCRDAEPQFYDWLERQG